MSKIYIRFAKIGEGEPYAIRKWSPTLIEDGVLYVPVTPLTDAAPDLLAALQVELAAVEADISWAESSELQALLARRDRMGKVIARAIATASADAGERVTA